MIVRLPFPHLAHSAYQAQLDLAFFAYVGSSKCSFIELPRLIERGSFGNPHLGRLELSKSLHDVLSADIAAGHARPTIRNAITSLRQFSGFCDDAGLDLNRDNLLICFKEWTESLILRARVERSITIKTAYDTARNVDRVACRAVGRSSLLKYTRLKKERRSVLDKFSARHDKENIHKTFDFGATLRDICTALTVDAVKGRLPLEIKLRSGKSFLEWSGLPNPLRSNGGQTEHAIKIASGRLEKANLCTDMSVRRPIINLRIEAELLVFIAQTGMNLAQAFKLKRAAYRFKTNGDDLIALRAHKPRRGGDVVFTVYKEYRAVLHEYLSWLDEFVPKDSDDRLFPFIYTSRIPLAGTPPEFSALRNRFRSINQPFYGPQTLRSTRINWLLRRTGNAALTADQAQHSKETLLTTYERPSLQRAIGEIASFHKTTNDASPAVGPGLCVSKFGLTQAEQSAQNDAAVPPDCVSPSGCLFCSFNRDIESLDHIWSLASLRFLKIRELDLDRRAGSFPTQLPASSVIERISLKIDYIKSQSDAATEWTAEVESRIREENFHPAWDGFIRCLEVS